ncbi:general secretion pathway protein GspB [Paraglaciecola sp. MB-3u-78]|uniref:general secretion pathway protein GspB n=1 Tax=Paraglaciecola sp. MB-3u-78 TaxID=2058332 RepID=UPI000C31CE03|nr:general secretion pathway protein GspB [Paraglaciecola sp. MB-3u-78]PKG98841.1 general secretion pathway protein GspB [Paraglaciecola sp. MB-3u-78]
MFRQINIQELQPGMVIVRITAQNGHVKIKKAGLVTSQNMVQGLIEMGIQQVEIDPDQTVEVDAKVEAPQIKKSATRRMLESNKVTHTRIDDGLSDQFHRSLYLPSVQDIPSAWQFYTKRYLLAAFIALGGLSLGWTLANYQEILTLWSLQTDKPVRIVSIAVPTAVAPATEQLDNKIEPSVKVDNLRDANTDVIINPAAQQVAGTDDIAKKSEPSDVVATMSPAPEPDPEPQISAEVLAKFRKAITEVADSPVTPPPVPSISSKNDVPRIDQLPAWVMNRLPSMAFSAHMYASIESERWVRVNGTRMVEGDKIDGMIEIVRIEPQHVILNYSGQTFSMAALTDW